MITRKPRKMPGLPIRAFLKNPAQGLDSIRAEYWDISSIRPFFAIFKRAVFLVMGIYLGVNGGRPKNMPPERIYVATKGIIISSNLALF